MPHQTMVQAYVGSGNRPVGDAAGAGSVVPDAAGCGGRAGAHSAGRCCESDGEVGMIGLVNRTAPPCKSCQHRHAKCHGQCEDYAVYLQDVQTDKEKRYAAYSEGDFYSMNIARRESAKKAIRKRDGR